MAEGESEAEGETEERSGNDEWKEKGLHVGQVRAVVSHAPTTDTLVYLELYALFLFKQWLFVRRKYMSASIFAFPAEKTFCPKGVFRIWSGTCGFLTT